MLFTRRCSRQDRTTALIFLRASLLTAERKDVKTTPSFRWADLGRKVYPRNVNVLLDDGSDPDGSTRAIDAVHEVSEAAAKD